MLNNSDNNNVKPNKLLLLYVILLFNNREFTVGELASEEYLRCSPSTISKLIRDLESSGLANIQVRKENRFLKYKLIKQDILKNISINSDGFIQLSFCRELLKGFLPENIQKNIDDTIDKTFKYLIDENYNIPSDIGGFIAKGRINYAPFIPIINTIISAIVYKNVCFIKYKASGKSKSKEYHFAPKRLIIFHESLYVEGYYVNDHGTVEIKYEDTSRLAIQRIQECLMTERSSSELRDVPRPNNKGFGFVIDEPFEAKIRFAKCVSAYIAEREWSENQSITYDDNGCLILIVNMNNINECISWVLSFKGNAEILEPRWLRKKISQVLNAMKRNYTN